MELSRRSFFAAAAISAASFALPAFADEAAPEEAAPEEGAPEEAVSEEAGSITAPAGTVEAAQQLMDALQGQYVELFPVINDKRDLWLKYAEPILGDAAGDFVDKMQAMMTTEPVGQEAVDAYAADPDSMGFNCFFPSGMATMAIDGNVISGFDADGNELFSHAYEYLCYNPVVDFYVFRSVDEDSGDFTYFAPKSDTMADTFHLEFRFGPTMDGIFDYFGGPYAYGLSAAIAADATDEQLEDCIELFVTENLAEMG